MLTEDLLWNYETTFRGEEKMDDVDCWVLEARPRQILQGQRFFDGLIWVDKKDYNIVRMEGQAVPQIRTTKQENLFPRFTTIRKPIDGKHWFPIYTYADDTPAVSHRPAARSGCGLRTATTGGSARNRRSSRSNGAEEPDTGRAACATC